MAKEFDIQVLNTVVMGVLEETFKKTCRTELAERPVVVEKEILEYNGCMRVFPLEKFNESAYVAAINYYLSSRNMENKVATGTFILFVKEEIVGKLLQAFGTPLSEVENEPVVLGVVGEFCNLLAGGVKNELVTLGYADLIVSSPSKYKNAVPEGVPFDYGLFRKQEISVKPWRQKCVVVEVCMGNVPQKAKE